MAQDEFTVQVQEATFVPDEAAIREFIRQLKAELDADPALRDRFDQDPRPIFSERGVCVDLQRQLILQSGMAGAEEMLDEMGCTVSCILVTQISCTGVTIVI